MPCDPTGTANQSPPFDVNVANEPNVSVTNRPENSVPAEDVQNTAFNPFQFDLSFSLGREESAVEAVVPAEGNEGQRVVIEHVTVAASAPRSQGVVAYIKIGEIKHSLVLTPSRGLEQSKALPREPVDQAVLRRGRRRDGFRSDRAQPFERDGEFLLHHLGLSGGPDLA